MLPCYYINISIRGLNYMELTQEDIETLRHDKLQEEADSRDADINNGWNPND
jgi:hypothetical protein